MVVIIQAAAATVHAPAITLSFQPCVLPLQLLWYRLWIQLKRVRAVRKRTFQVFLLLPRPTVTALAQKQIELGSESLRGMVS